MHKMRQGTGGGDKEGREYSRGWGDGGNFGKGSRGKGIDYPHTFPSSHL